MNDWRGKEVDSKCQSVGHLKILMTKRQAAAALINGEIDGPTSLARNLPFTAFNHLHVDFSTTSDELSWTQEQQVMAISSQSRKANLRVS